MYEAGNLTTSIGTGTVATDGTSVVVQTDLDAAGGEIVVIVTRDGQASLPSEAVSYDEEETTTAPPAPTAGQIEVTNTDATKTVTVSGLQAGDVVNVYEAGDLTTSIGTGTVAADGTSVVVQTDLDVAGGEIVVIVTRDGQASLPSEAVSYDEEETTTVAPPAPEDIIVENNEGTDADTVVVNNVQAGDIVRVYAADGTTLLAQQTATGTSVTIPVSLTPETGGINVTITRGGVESAQQPSAYDPETITAPTAGTPTVTATGEGVVVVNGVRAGDRVILRNGQNIVGEAVASADGSVTIFIASGGLDPQGGTLEMVLQRGTLTSDPIIIDYDAAPADPVQPPTQIVINRTGDTGGTVVVGGLQDGDTITVTDASGTTVTSQPAVNGSASVDISVAPAGGSIQVVVNRDGQTSSVPTTVSYDPAPPTVPSTGTVSIVNNGATGSSVTVSGLQGGDVVTLYGPNGSSIIGRAVVPQGADSVTITLALNAAGGSIQVGVNRGGIESAIVPISYPVSDEGTGTPPTQPETPTTPAEPGVVPADPAPGTPTPAPNPVTPETNPVTPETEGEGEELDVPGRIVTLTMREPRTFNDISGYWAQSAIERLAALGVIDGLPDGSFAPRETLSRAQFTKMVATLLGINSQNSPIFSDTPAGRWYTASIQGAYEQGIVNGYTGGNFDPDEPVTREEMAKILTNAMLWLNPDVFPNSPDYAAAEAFRDYGRVGNWAQEPISRMLEEGILIGKTNGVLDPKGNATRAEAATVLVRLIERMSDNFTS